MSSPTACSVKPQDTLPLTDLRHPQNAALVANLRELLSKTSTSEFLDDLSSTITGITEPLRPTGNKCCTSTFRCSHDTNRVLFSFFYLLSVGFLTAVVMTIVHDRVPDTTTYPPLPDLVLDNLPHIHWAFELAEIMILTLGIVFLGILLLHRYRWIVFRRFTAITGTVFLLRCVTMLVTSLSVPGSHLKCDVEIGATNEEKLLHAWKIFSHLALSMLTILNYFINDYTPDSWRGLHTFAWVLNCFGMFFILAGHEHYTIDVFIAFYISSRLFLYYHSLANSEAVKSAHGERVRGYFPMFSYLEECTTGMLPNIYEWPWVAAKRWWGYAWTYFVPPKSKRV